MRPGTANLHDRETLGRPEIRTFRPDGRLDIPAVDLTGWRAGHPSVELIETVDRALRATGFLLVRGHDITPELAADVREQALRFFHLPTATKAAYASPSGVPGWHGLFSEASAKVYGIDGPPDLKEGFMFVAAEGTTLVAADGTFAARNVDVAEVPCMVPAAERYIAANAALADDLLSLLALALGDTTGALRAATRAPMASLSVNWYPPLSHVGSVEPEQFRIGPHADYGTITILDREPGLGSLQVMRADGAWVSPPHEPGTLVVNLGDLMAHWTGGRWRSSMHRVLPPDPAAAHEELCSLVYFVEADHDATIEVFPPPIGGGAAHPPMHSSDWLRERLAAVAV